MFLKHILFQFQFSKVNVLLSNKLYQNILENDTDILTVLLIIF